MPFRVELTSWDRKTDLKDAARTIKLRATTFSEAEMLGDIAKALEGEAAMTMGDLWAFACRRTEQKEAL